MFCLSNVIKIYISVLQFLSSFVLVPLLFVTAMMGAARLRSFLEQTLQIAHFMS